MKIAQRVIAFLLTLSLFCGISIGAWAETVTLPASLTVIEDEAFAGDFSLDKVEIPEGTVSIGARAFAGSSVNAVYIPDSVTKIGSMAFANIDHVTIISTPDSYAHTYAVKNKLDWADVSAYDYNKQLDEVRDSFTYTYEPESVVPESSNFDIEITDGVTDPAMLAFLEEYNEHTFNQMELNNAFMSDMDGIISNMGGMMEDLSDAGVKVDSGSVSVESEGVFFTVPQSLADILGDDMRVVSTSCSDSGELDIVLTSGGGEYHLRGTMEGVSLITPLGDSIQFMSVTFDGSMLVSFMQKCWETLNEISSRVTILSMFMDDSVERTEKLLAEEKAKETLARESQAKLETKEDIQRAAKMEARAYNQAAVYERNLLKLRGFKIALGVISAPLDVMSFKDDLDSFNELEAIAKHGHPTEADFASTQRQEIAERMMEHLRRAQQIYVVNMASTLVSAGLNLVDLITNIQMVIPGAQPALIAEKAAVFAVRTSMNILNYLVGVVAGSQASTLYESAKKGDAKLHMKIKGQVIDSETREPLPLVKVLCTFGPDLVSAVTDRDGRFTVEPLGEAELVLKLEDYDQKKLKVTEEMSKQRPLLIEMDHETGDIFCFVTDYPRTKGLEKAAITCGDKTGYTDARGDLRLKLRTGEHTLHVELNGYAPEDKQVTVVKGKEQIVEIQLKPYGEIWNREDLENIAQHTDYAYKLMDNIDLGDADWTPLPWFSGTFDGNDHYIYNMHISGSNGGAALFEGLNGATVKNLRMEDAVINVPIDTEFKNAAVICGQMIQNSVVDNCTISGNITVTDGNGDVFVGGAVGLCTGGRVDGTYATVNIDVQAHQNVFAGGVAGRITSGSARLLGSFGNISVRQTKSNSGARMFVNGIGMFDDQFLEGGNLGAVNLTLETIDAEGYAHGLYHTSYGESEANVTAKTKNGNVSAYGCSEGVSCSSSGKITAAATGTGSVNAVGLYKISYGSNSGAVRATAKKGNASAYGGMLMGQESSNSGTIRATTGTGTAVAYGLSGQAEGDRNPTNCTNTGSVTAVATSGKTLAVGVSDCTTARNTGAVTSQLGNGNAVAQGITNCTHSENTGNVSLTYQGTDGIGGNTSAHGLSSCSSSVNRGNVSVVVLASNTKANVAGASKGSENTNYGSVEARSNSGQTNATGLSGSNGHNYGYVLAYSSSLDYNASPDPAATGVGVSGSGNINRARVTAISAGSAAWASGFEGSNSASYDLVLAQSTHYVRIPVQDGYQTYIGKAGASNSVYTVASTAGVTASAVNGQRYSILLDTQTNLIYVGVSGGMQLGYAYSTN